jgi:Ca-activated chloride channel family protein
VRNSEWGIRHWIILFVVTGIFLPAPVVGAENPDELYRQGRFAEAEKIYARSDMDNPKDLRHRYNRGCANYQGSNYKGAMAAFSSVLRRAKDKETRIKAAYNLGNTAFKQGDFASAAAYYKQVILLDPEKENAQFNLEIALRKLDEQKKEKQEEQKTSGQKGGKKDPSKPGKPNNNSSEKKGDQKKEQDDKSAGKKPEEDKKQDKGKEDGQDSAQKAAQESPKDLSGDLRTDKALPEQRKKEKSHGQAVSLMDKKKAEALLDNVKEDRSKFLELQMQKGKPRGGLSGKDW